jgi:hypothetical protein
MIDFKARLPEPLRLRLTEFQPAAVKGTGGTWAQAESSMSWEGSYRSGQEFV